jgi:hypothetical protein
VPGSAIGSSSLSAWLGHHDGAFTMKTYGHLMDDGLGDAAFMDDLFSPQGATGGQHKARDEDETEAARMESVRA